MRLRKKNADPRLINIRANNLNGVFSSITQNMVPPFLGIYARDLGASYLQYGLLTALPAFLTSLTLIPTQRWLQGRRNKVSLTAILTAISRLFYPLFALASFFHPSVWLLLIFVAFSAFPSSWANLTWTSLIAEAIPEADRAAAFSSRNRLMAIFGIVAVMATGQLMDILAVPLNYRLIFFGSVLFSVLEVYYLLALRPLSKEEVRGRDVPLRELLRSSPDFRNFAVGTLLFQLGFQMALPLFTIYTVQHLQATAGWVSAIAIASGVAQIGTYPLWARWSTSFGGVVALVWSTLLLSLSPLLYAISTSLWPILFFNLLIGFAWAGVNLVTFNYLLEVCPPAKKEKAIAFYNTMVNVAATICPILGVVIADWIGIRLALVITALLRAVGGLHFYLKGRAHFGPWLLPKCYLPRKRSLL